MQANVHNPHIQEGGNQWPILKSDKRAVCPVLTPRIGGICRIHCFHQNYKNTIAMQAPFLGLYDVIPAYKRGGVFLEFIPIHKRGRVFPEFIPAHKRGGDSSEVIPAHKRGGACNSILRHILRVPLTGSWELNCTHWEFLSWAKTVNQISCTFKTISHYEQDLKENESIKDELINKLFSCISIYLKPFPHFGQRRSTAGP